MKIVIQDEEGDGKPRTPKEGFANEAQLQAFLRDNAELIPVDDIELGSPPLLCIGSEVRSRGKSESTATSGWLDILYVDESATLTIIEAKLGENRESHREVVGQILEYAAYASSWNRSDLEERADSFFRSADCPADCSGLDLETALVRFLDEKGVKEQPFDYEEFIDELENKLNNGRMRLIIAIDEPPDSLIRIVQFVNQFSLRFEIYVFQLKRFHDEDVERKQNIFVPRIIGRVNRVASRTRSQPRDWARDSFLQQVAEKAPATRDVMVKLMDFAEQCNAIAWGRGAKIGTFGFHVLNPEGEKVPAYTAYGTGQVQLDFRTLTERTDPATASAYREALRSAQDIPDDVVNTDTWKSFDALLLREDRSWDPFTEAVRVLTRLITESD